MISNVVLLVKVILNQLANYHFKLFLCRLWFWNVQFWHNNFHGFTSRFCVDPCTYLDASTIKETKEYLTLSEWPVGDTCFVLDNDAQFFTISANSKSSGTDCSLPFLCFINRNNAPFSAQINEYIYDVFALVDDGSFRKYLEWINYMYMWKRSSSFKLILVYLWFQVVPLPAAVTYISSADEFDGWSGHDGCDFVKSAFASHLFWTHHLKCQ